MRRPSWSKYSFSDLLEYSSSLNSRKSIGERRVDLLEFSLDLGYDFADVNRHFTFDECTLKSPSERYKHALL